MSIPPVHSGRIVVVDDVRTNVLLVERILGAAGFTDVIGTTEPTQAAELVRDLAPDLLLLDLHMAEVDGFGVLDAVRRHDSELPVLIVTADASTRARQNALMLGASDFLTKPVESAELIIRASRLLENRFLQQERRQHATMLEERVRERTHDLDVARLELLERIGLVAEFRDDDTFEHAQRVGRCAELLARELSWETVPPELIRRAAPLHDIGKVGISDAVLLKPGRYTPDEFAAMTAHVEIGARILAGSQSPVLQMAAEIAHCHHERWDGAGYLQGLSGHDIPATARVVAVADVFDALAHERPYKPAMPIPEAVEIIASGSGAHFDPEVAAAFAGLDHGDLVAPVLAAA